MAQPLAGSPKDDSPPCEPEVVDFGAGRNIFLCAERVARSNVPKCSTFAADLEIKCSKVEHLTVARPENDPKLVAAARELRDRWLEEVNSGRYLPEACGKYDPSRAIADDTLRKAGNQWSALPAPVAA